MLASTCVRERLGRADLPFTERITLWLERVAWGWTTGYGTQLGRHQPALACGLGAAVAYRSGSGRACGSVDGRDRPVRRHRAIGLPARAAAPGARIGLDRRLQRLGFSFGLVFSTPDSCCVRRNHRVPASRRISLPCAASAPSCWHSWPDPGQHQPGDQGHRRQRRALTWRAYRGLHYCEWRRRVFASRKVAVWLCPPRTYVRVGMAPSSPTTDLRPGRTRRRARRRARNPKEEGANP